MIERLFGWLFVALGLVGIIGIVGYGATWQLLMVGACALMAWSCFSEAHKEAQRKKA